MNTIITIIQLLFSMGINVNIHHADPNTTYNCDAYYFEKEGTVIACDIDKPTINLYITKDTK